MALEKNMIGILSIDLPDALTTRKVVLPSRIELQGISLVAEAIPKWDTELDPGGINLFLELVLNREWRGASPAAEVRFRFATFVTMPDDVLAETAGAP
ncbi:hypothetical protein J7337_004990 [Fusarium musae]|uniref:Uncharacterized protein n=1 Tax=Fusarium musae TaxID=1042133 RepID=A0A9P8DHL4_9HYPO|nr:hypothetical protein J7337_004990 [Fusarium musae]KAG9502165.1 hypothetical protein J7337_004990 [Fusarium musae]